MALYVGLDASTQSLSAIAIELGGATRRVVFQDSLPYDSTFPQYHTRNGVLRGDDPRVVTAPPLMWAEALDRMLKKLAGEIDVQQIAAISGSAQQHGSVYLNASAASVLAGLKPASPLADQLRPIFSRPVAPVWMDTSTTAECHKIQDAAGGREVLAERTGSRAYERFTGPQIRKFYKQSPQQFDATERIHLVSSFHASLLCGAHAPIDAADASGMNLMDLTSQTWWPPALHATAPGLPSKLPDIVDSWRAVGSLAPYWREKYGYPEVPVIAWSGDNPCSAIGTGLAAPGIVTISLGTSDTVFGVMPAPHVDPAGTGHVFRDTTGLYLGLTCFQNGALTRKRVRDKYGITWEAFSLVLEETAAGNGGGLMLPWFDAEITPPVAHPHPYRRGFDEDDAERNIRGVVEGQVLAMRRHSAWMGTSIVRIHATGGGARNRAVLQVIADVFGVDVHQLSVGNSAALGAALRAVQAVEAARGHDPSWFEVIDGFVESREVLRPRPDAQRLYSALLVEYGKFEEDCLTRLPTLPDDAASQSTAS